MNHQLIRESDEGIRFNFIPLRRMSNVILFAPDTKDEFKDMKTIMMP